MKLDSINEIAYKLEEQLEGQKYGSKERLKREDCSDKLWTLVGFLSDDYLFDFLISALSDLSNIDDDIERPEELPRNDNPKWTNPKLKDWLEYERNHYEVLEDIVKQYLQPKEIPNFDLSHFIQIAIWQEMDMVYNAVVEYLFEAYNAQEDIDEDDAVEDDYDDEET
jgi:hypothetical protein